MAETQSEERRHFQRIPLDRPASLVVDGTRLSCKLSDISLKGALVIPQTDWHGNKGTKVELDIVLHDMDGATIHMAGEIAHVGEGHVGILCRQLDLDSATLLRRVIELNLADPDLLERELLAMIESG